MGHYHLSEGEERVHNLSFKWFSVCYKEVTLIFVILCASGHLSFVYDKVCVSLEKVLLDEKWSQKNLFKKGISKQFLKFYVQWTSTFTMKEGMELCTWKCN